MIEARTLLAAALVVPSCMAAARPPGDGAEPDAVRYWPSPRSRRLPPCCLRPMASLAEVQHACTDSRPRSSRSRAARRCGAVVDHVRRICFAISAGPPELRTICGVLVDDPDRLRGHISSCRHGGLLFSSCAAHARRLRPRHQPRNAPRMAGRRYLCRARAAGRSVPAHGFRVARHANPGR